MTAKRTAIKVEGLGELLRDLNRLPKESQRELRRASFEIADDVARDVRGWLGTPQAAPLLERVRARNDRVPTIKVGGESKAKVSGGATLNNLLGANFGTRGRAPQFPPRKVPDYYVFTVIKHRSHEITRTWVEAVGRALATIDPRANYGA